MVLEATVEVSINKLVQELRSWYKQGYYLSKAPQTGTKPDTYVLTFRNTKPNPQFIDHNVHVEEKGVIQVHGLKIDLDAYQVSCGGTLIQLTRTQFKLLAILASNVGTVISPAALLSTIHQANYTEMEAQEILKVHIRRLRQKVEPGGGSREPEIILTVRGIGYKMVD